MSFRTGSGHATLDANCLSFARDCDRGDAGSINDRPDYIAACRNIQSAHRQKRNVEREAENRINEMCFFIYINICIYTYTNMYILASRSVDFLSLFRLCVPFCEKSDISRIARLLRVRRSFLSPFAFTECTRKKKKASNA